MSRNTKNPVVLLVCNRCGHMWEPNEGSKKPQCSQCKSSSRHAADSEERAAFIAGMRISPYFKDQPDNEESDRRINAESESDKAESDQLIKAESDADNTDNRADNADSKSDSFLPEIVDIDVDSLIHSKSEKKGTSGLNYVIVGAVVLIGGALIGWFLLPRHGRKNDAGRIQRKVESERSEGFYGFPSHEAF